MKILVVLFGISLFFKGLQSIVYRKFTTYAGIAETRTVFTNTAAIFWGICLVSLSSVVLLWATIPQYFQNPIFKVGNVLLAYVVAYILAWLIQLLQNNVSR
jgi:xanthine/uracil permease